MDQFLQDLGSTYWWIGVVVVGIVINIVSQYIPKLFGILIKGSKSIGEKGKEANQRRIDQMIDHPMMIVENMTYALYVLIISLVISIPGILFSIALIIITSGILRGIFFILLFLVGITLTWAFAYSSLLMVNANSAREKLMEKERDAS